MKCFSSILRQSSGRVLRRTHGESSFTLIELLIVIGILAILTAVVVIILNPGELLKESRDSTRMSDLASINSAIQLLLSQNPSVNLGTASTVYVSLPDTSTTCSNLGLPTLPSGYTYHCVTATNQTLTNGNGWIPVDLTSSNIQNMAHLPIDPTNASSTGLYYTYTPNPAQGTFEVTSLMESDKYAYKEAQDGGVDPASYEAGTNTSLTPFVHGLVGYWSFDEGSGTTAYDGSGWGNNGTMYASSTPTYVLTSSGCKEGNCLNTSSILANYINTNLQNSLQNRTLSAWIYGTSFPITGHVGNPIIDSDYPAHYGTGLGINGLSTNNVLSFIGNDGWLSMPYIFSTNNWYFVTATFDRSTNSISGYVNGQLISSNPFSFSSSESTFYPFYIGKDPANIVYFNGLIDDVRIYNRALSPAEILALYNATK